MLKRFLPLIALTLLPVALSGSPVPAASASAAPGTAEASDKVPSHRHRYPRLVARELLGVRGGVVRGGGVGLRIPTGVLRRRAWVQIERISRYAYDFHIFGPWHGVVTVNLPSRGRPPLVAHRLQQGWVIEPARVRDGRAVIEVRQLSLFSNLWTCARKGLVRALACLVEKGVRWIPLQIVKKLVGPEYDPCLPVGPGNISIDAWEILTSPCAVGDPPQSDPPPPPPSAPATPTPPPPSAPTPTPSAPTPPPPPPPSNPPPSSPSRTVSLSKGSSAQGLPGCSSSYCRYMVVTWKGFSSGTHSITCRASGGDEGGFYTYQRSGSSGSSTYCYYGFPGRTVWVTVDGVSSNRITW